MDDEISTISLLMLYENRWCECANLSIPPVFSHWCAISFSLCHSRKNWMFMWYAQHIVLAIYLLQFHNHLKWQCAHNVHKNTIQMHTHTQLHQSRCELIWLRSSCMCMSAKFFQISFDCIILPIVCHNRNGQNVHMYSVCMKLCVSVCASISIAVCVWWKLRKPRMETFERERARGRVEMWWMSKWTALHVNEWMRTGQRVDINAGYTYKHIYYLLWYIYIKRGEAKRARDIHTTPGDT